MANLIIKPRNIGIGTFLWAFQEARLSPGVLRRHPLVGGAIGGSPLPEAPAVSFVEKGEKLVKGQQIELPLISPIWIKAGHLSYMVWRDGVFVKLRSFIGRDGPPYSDEVLLDKMDRTYLIGRHPGTEPDSDPIQFYDPSLSRTHFSVRVNSKTASLIVADIHSRHGTAVFWRGMEVASEAGWEAVERIAATLLAGIELGFPVQHRKRGFSQKYLEPDFTLRMFVNAEGDLFQKQAEEPSLFPVEFTGLNGRIIAFRLCRQGYTGNVALLAAAVEMINSKAK